MALSMRDGFERTSPDHGDLLQCPGGIHLFRAPLYFYTSDGLRPALYLLRLGLCFHWRDEDVINGHSSEGGGTGLSIGGDYGG